MLTETVAGRTYDYSHNVGQGASTGPGFYFGVDLALGTHGVAYVLNRGNGAGLGQRVSMLTLGSQGGEEEYIGEFASYGDGAGQLIWPAGIAIDSRRNVYISDAWLNRVSVFDEEGNLLRCWDAVQPGDGGPNGISSIAVDPDDTLYITDGRSHQVRKFTTDGKLLESWGQKGSGEGELDSPWGIAVDADGFVYLADNRNHRVQKFTSGGDYVAQFGQPGVKKGKLTWPNDVAVDPEGDVYVCDWSKNAWGLGRVQIFDAQGQFLTSLAGDAQQLSKWGQRTVDANPDYMKRRREVRSTEPEWTFAQPTAVVFDAANSRLLVMDTQRSRVQIYNKLSGYLAPQLNL